MVIEGNFTCRSGYDAMAQFLASGRVIDAVEKAPRWQPAMRDGKPVESEGVLRVQLPEGKSVPRPLEFIMR